MSGSVELNDEIGVSRSRYASSDPGGGLGASVVSPSVSVFTESDYDRLGDRTNLSAGLTQITSRLLQQLANGGENTVDISPAPAGPRRDTSGNRVPPDDSPLVSWRRVVAVYAAGRLHAFVSLPVLSPSAQTEAQAAIN
jgi:hypothetical protein